MTLASSPSSPIVSQCSTRARWSSAHPGRRSSRPQHPYTVGLIDGARVRAPGLPFGLIAGSVPEPGSWPPGCRFAPRCPIVAQECGEHPGSMPSVATWLDVTPGQGGPAMTQSIEISSLVKEYRLGRGHILRAVRRHLLHGAGRRDLRHRRRVRQRQDDPGEDAAQGFVRPTSGRDGSMLGVDPWHANRAGSVCPAHRLMQVAFQDPYSSMNPRMRTRSDRRRGRAPRP
jgi:oligopeptide/dipeptide ABC transporter ATP-binding protein